jgi:hypothetical protein
LQLAGALLHIVLAVPQDLRILPQLPVLEVGGGDEHALLAGGGGRGGGGGDRRVELHSCM